MADLVKGMRNWLAYSTMDEDEWDTMRLVHLEEEVRRLFVHQAETLRSAGDSSELGEVSVPVRSGAFRRLRHLSGRVFLSRDEYEDGERYKIHLLVSSGSAQGQESWQPLCDWTFESMSEVADFANPPSAEPAS